MYALAACCAGLCCSSRRNVAGCGELMMTSRLSISGRCAASVPGDRAAPVMRDQRLDPPARLLIDQRGDVGDQVLGAVRLDLLGAEEGPKPRRFGAMQRIAVAEMLEQFVPDERRLRESRAGTRAPACRNGRWPGNPSVMPCGSTASNVWIMAISAPAAVAAAPWKCPSSRPGRVRPSDAWSSPHRRSPPA